MAQKALILMPNTQRLWVLDDDTLAITDFSPSIVGICDLAGYCVQGFPTGEIIVSLRQYPGDGDYHFYHYEPNTPVWTDKGVHTGKQWDLGATSYQNVWSSGGDTDFIYHFDGSTWTEDAEVAGSRKLQVYVSGTGLDEAFIAGTDNILFRRSGAIGSGVWTDHRAQLLADIGLDISGDNPDCVGVWGTDKDNIYWLLRGTSNSSQHWVVKWTGPWPGTFTIISTSSTKSYGVSDSSFDATDVNRMWWMTVDPAWGKFHFVYFDGTNILRQGVGEVPDGPEHNLGAGCKLRFHPVTGIGYAVGHLTGPQRIEVWKQAAVGNGLWSTFADTTVTLGSGQAAISFYDPNPDDIPPIIENQDPADGEQDVDSRTDIVLDIVDHDEVGGREAEASGVDPDTVVITVEGQTVWQNDAATGGWSGAKIAITDGFRYTLDSPSRFDSAQRVNVYAIAEDFTGNQKDESWAFTIFDSVPLLHHQLNVLVEEVGVPEPRHVWNQFDEHGATVSLSRNLREKNWAYKRRILDTFVHMANSSYNGLVNAVTRELGLALVQPLRVNPKISQVDGRFFAPDPCVKFDGAWVYLYSDYANGVLDYQIDRYITGGNYEHLTRLVDFVNSTTYFEASLEADADPYMSSMCILNQSNRVEVRNEEVPVSTRFKLQENYIVAGSLLFTDVETFGVEVALEGSVTSLGQYWIDRTQGIIRTYRPPVARSSVGYQYSEYPFLPDASPVVLCDINSEAFRVKMFGQVLQDDGSYSHGIPTEIGVDIINELISVTPMYWGINTGSD